MANSVAYGFIDLQTLANQRVQDVGPRRVWDAVRISTDEYNRVTNGLLAAWATTTVDAQEQFELPSGGTLQPLDEFGIPLPVQPSGSYQVAYPLQGGGTAWATDRVSTALLTVDEANRLTLDAMRRDKDWLLRHAMAAVLDNVPYPYNDKPSSANRKGLGAITVQPLANGDGVLYLRSGAIDPATDNHYLAQANAIDDSNNPFSAIYNELMEHPSNSGPVVVYVAQNLVQSIRGLNAFVQARDNDITAGANSDVLNTMIDAGFADRVLGKVEECWVLEWSKLPAGYMIAHASGNPFLKMREYDAPELRGFFPEQYSPDGAITENRMIRYAGFGVADRVAALVYQIGSASYSIPAGYDAPLKV